MVRIEVFTNSFHAFTRRTMKCPTPGSAVQVALSAIARLRST
jgi:hypothetical protein